MLTQHLIISTVLPNILIQLGFTSIFPHFSLFPDGNTFNNTPSIFVMLSNSRRELRNRGRSSPSSSFTTSNPYLRALEITVHGPDIFRVLASITQVLLYPLSLKVLILNISTRQMSHRCISLFLINFFINNNSKILFLNWTNFFICFLLELHSKRAFQMYH